jgi:low temperature requirement protein LtrA
MTMRLALSRHANLLRDRGEHESSRVTYVELFFDLVFVFAITQLSHTMLAHFTTRGVVEVTLLLMAMWWVWNYTSWITNWLDPRLSPVRLMLLVLMFGCLLLSTSIPHAFGDTGRTFAVAYVLVQLGRSLFMVWALRGYAPDNERNFWRISAWFGFSAPFWLAGGFVEGDARLVLWLIGLAIDYLGPVSGFRLPVLGPSQTSTWDISPAHLAERCGLFVIIALGESILVSGATFADLDRSFVTVAAFVTAFVGSLSMWWVYFGTVADQAGRHFEAAANPGQVARTAYTYLHLPIIAGIIVVAVGDELVLAHPEGHSGTETIIAVIGGPALYLLGTFLFKVVSSLGRFPVSHLVGFALLLVVLLVARELSPLLLSGITTVILLVVAGWESIAARLLNGAAPEPVLDRE